MLICSTCSAGFEDRNQYSSHTKHCVGDTVTFVYQNQNITVKKNTEGAFDCYCSDVGCPGKKRVYKTIEGLKKHLKKVKSHWIGTSKVILTSWILVHD